MASTLRHKDSRRTYLQIHVGRDVLAAHISPSLSPGPSALSPHIPLRATLPTNRGRTRGRVAGREALLRQLVDARFVQPIAELLHHPLVEERNVRRLTARDQLVVDMHRLVHPRAARIPNIGLEARPRSDRPA